MQIVAGAVVWSSSDIQYYGWYYDQMQIVAGALEQWWQPVLWYYDQMQMLLQVEGCRALIHQQV